MMLIVTARSARSAAQLQSDKFIKLFLSDLPILRCPVSMDLAVQGGPAVLVLRQRPAHLEPLLPPCAHATVLCQLCPKK